MRNRILPFAIALLVAVPAVLSAQDDLTREPGYFDLDQFAKLFNTEPVVEVNLKGFLLSMVAGATRSAEPELSKLLFDLKLVRVERYRLDRDQIDAVRERSSEASKLLKAKGWERIVRVRERDEDVHVFVKPGDNVLRGIVVLAVENSREATFVNIVGTINPEEIGRLGSKWDIGGLDSIRFEYQR